MSSPASVVSWIALGPVRRLLAALTCGLSLLAGCGDPDPGPSPWIHLQASERGASLEDVVSQWELDEGSVIVPRIDEGVAKSAQRSTKLSKS